MTRRISLLGIASSDIDDFAHNRCARLCNHFSSTPERLSQRRGKPVTPYFGSRGQRSYRRDSQLGPSLRDTPWATSPSL
jgi:hypothetical protein